MAEKKKRGWLVRWIAVSAVSGLGVAQADGGRYDLSVVETATHHRVYQVTVYEPYSQMIQTSVVRQGKPLEKGESSAFSPLGNDMALTFKVSSRKQANGVAQAKLEVDEDDPVSLDVGQWDTSPYNRHTHCVGASAQTALISLICGPYTITLSPDI